MNSILLAIIALMATIQTGVIIYFVFRWREILNRLAIIIIDKWLAGQGLSESIY